MTVLIITDLEGVSGVGDGAMIQGIYDKAHDGYRYACERLMLDTNAAVDGAIKAGAERVLVIDGHSSGNNFNKGELDPRAEQVVSLNDAVREADAMLGVGVHAMAGTINGFLDHTQSSKSWYNYYVNGRKCGEFAQGLIFGGMYDVPYVMVSGDEAACVEARSFVPEIECATVKYGIGRNRARLMDLDEALTEISTAAQRGVSKAKDIKPYKPIYPIEIKLELYRTDMCDEVMQRVANVERVDARTVRKLLDAPVSSFRDILF